ncbi:nicotinate-nucleotide-dimethylbenzimidazole phosphoribosyltransferase [Nitrosomonas cryotolerans]|uniref:Nicotinate-nucleotide--dimethylbenzimidazole phosphoribosyltransferase n=1 Tax=Nitrosomonas cryotolerans ATCC 49181 TaxID=1131553 RepID=A0A1N6H103_9PROT|nr:nicotinate-nucleotide--dimethylbenzimidazole phosphoribosyltransferase [Nitrosomonas cryotolerans]SFQ12536.1 nicotinate-nucleotide-dimethylbenzimidazole phosphoribosyltransferase [Nitrosomonas cryotolerans]SIO13474.1 nicotinate-nucleotide-dimethylbenzimidazole phosphoribosyltransferase [Nitrosomonas cryotolerans ATCC 49181]
MNETAAIDWLNEPFVIPNAKTRQAAQARQAQLTKPSGSLGRLEDIAIHLASLQGTLRPDVERVQITIFAGDHGVAAEGVSAFPQAVTCEMIRNFANGGAAISVLAQILGVQLEVINMGTAQDTEAFHNVSDYRLGPGTANFIHEPAMTIDQLTQALQAGRHAIERTHSMNTQLFIGGEMGIANTTAATALACILLDTEAVLLVGPGTGLDTHGIAHKTTIIQRALDLHSNHITSPLEALRRVGGFEIAALTGAYLRCAQLGIPVLIDGFISSVAALTAEQLRPGMKNWLLFSHTSAEPGHNLILDRLNAKPLCNLGLRLGEGSGAAITLPLLRMACTLHNEMATFSEAQVSGKTEIK